MARVATVVCLALVAGAHAFAPAGMVPGARLSLRKATSARSVTAMPKMSIDVNQIADGAQTLLAAVPNVPFVDEITGEPQGFTAPIVHFGSVSMRIPVMEKVEKFMEGSAQARL